MSQRNPMNERYTTDDGRKGVTRKSAASAKPKAKAAASVYIEPAKKTPQRKGILSSLFGGGSQANRANEQSKAAAEKKQGQANSQPASRANYYHPPTPEYRSVRRVWFVCLGCALFFTVLSFLLQYVFGQAGPVVIVVLVLAYISIGAALYLDFFKLRKMRIMYATTMDSAKTKAAKKRRQEYEEALRTQEEERERLAAEKAAKKAGRKGFFSKNKADGEAATEDTSGTENGDTSSEVSSSKKSGESAG